MAQPRPVIKSVEEATCGNCIYSVVDEKEVWCKKEIGDDDTALAHWCGEGIWLLYSGRVEGMKTKSCASTLEEVYEWFTE
jgi:hypothetical protein